MKKLEAAGVEQDSAAGDAEKPKKTAQMLEANLTEDETRVLNTIRARQMLRSEDIMDIEHLGVDVIDGRRINMERGSLGLATPMSGKQKKEAVDVMALLVGEEKMQAEHRAAAELDAAHQRTEVSAF